MNKLKILFCLLVVLMLSFNSCKKELTNPYNISVNISDYTKQVYDGYNIYTLTSTLDDERIQYGIETIKQNIDSLNALNVFSEEELDFFRSHNIWLAQEGTAHFYLGPSQVGEPTERNGILIDVTPPIAELEIRRGTHPYLLLHEFCHAYHDQKIPNGFNNVKIIDAFNHAIENQLYPMLDGRITYIQSNHNEYFADLSVLFFGGSVYYPPYNLEGVTPIDPQGLNVIKDAWGR